jgi:hypothetical protein
VRLLPRGISMKYTRRGFLQKIESLSNELFLAECLEQYSEKFSILCKLVLLDDAISEDMIDFLISHEITEGDMSRNVVMMRHMMMLEVMNKSNVFYPPIEIIHHAKRPFLSWR